MVDLDKLEKRVRVAAEIGRLRMALRFSAFVAAGVAVLCLVSPRPEPCVCLGTLVFVLTTYFRWKSSFHGRAATAGVVLGSLVLLPVFLLRRIDPSWDCGQHVSSCVSMGIAILVIGGRWLWRHDNANSRTLSEVGVVGLMAGLVALTACVGAGVAALGTVVWVVIMGLASRSATLRFATR